MISLDFSERSVAPFTFHYLQLYTYAYRNIYIYRSYILTFRDHISLVKGTRSLDPKSSKAWTPGLFWDIHGIDYC